MNEIPPNWTIADSDPRAVRALASELRVPRIVASLLHTRGMSSPANARAFLQSLDIPLTDPLTMAGMSDAVERIAKSRRQNEHVRVVGDYDVDGISGAALMVRALKRTGVETVSYTIPHRLADGYGLNVAIVERAAEEGVDLIVTVDNGTKSIEAVDRANALGIDVIVTDHHTIDGELPRAAAIVNPRLDGPDHPCAAISGAGVALKVGAALSGEHHDIGLAAMGTVSDIVTLLGENRAIVARGIRELSSAAHPGITVLAQRAGIDIADLRAEHIAFQLGPRINAAGRIGDPTVALRLLLAESEGGCALMAEQLHAANEQRRRIESVITERAEVEAGRAVEAGHSIIVIGSRDWHQGVLGIVASKLVDRYHRPVVLVAFGEDGLGKGSGRSPSDFNLVEAIGNGQDLLVRFGGHRAAAGLTITEENFGPFRERMAAHAKGYDPSANGNSRVAVDAIASFSEIDPQLLHGIDRLEPFGHGNPAPVLCTFGVEIVPESVRELRGGHASFSARHDGRQVKVIAFGFGDKIPLRALAGPADIAYTPKLNTWRGDTSIQLQLKDVVLASR
ncbi:MAG: single-stranded-DNA-specific exonuclease RecJ [Candidatus Hydrogenedentota bacterium]